MLLFIDAHVEKIYGAGNRIRTWKIGQNIICTWKWDSDHAICKKDKNRSYSSPSVWARTLKSFDFIWGFSNALEITMNHNSCQSKAFMFLSLPQITSPLRRK